MGARRSSRTMSGGREGAGLAAHKLRRKIVDLVVGAANSAGVVFAWMAGSRPAMTEGWVRFSANRVPCCTQLSRFSALSCQRRSKRWESVESMKKMTMPLIESRASAAKRRGILRRTWLSTMR